MPFTGNKPSLGNYYQSHRDNYNYEGALRFKGKPAFFDAQDRETFRHDVLDTAKADLLYILNENSIGSKMQRDFMLLYTEIFKNIFDHAGNTGTCLFKILDIDPSKENDFHHGNKIAFHVYDANTHIVNRNELLTLKTNGNWIKKGDTNSGGGLVILDLIKNGDQAPHAHLTIDTSKGGIRYTGSLTMSKKQQGKLLKSDDILYLDKSIKL